MQRFLSIAILAAFPFTGFSQTLHNNGATLNIQAGGTLYISGDATIASGTVNNSGNLRITGNVSNNGSFTTTAASAFVLEGTTAQTVSGTAYAVNNITISNSAGVTLSTAMVVTDALAVTAGQFITGNNLTLKSTSPTSTARVAPITSSSSPAITGNVTVERFIPDMGKRAWRLLSVPTTGTQTIRDAWQEGGAAVSDLGTLITAPIFNGSNGFDMSSNSSSILIHDQGGASGPSWTTIPVTNTNATLLDSRPGYMLYVRGDRTATPTNAIRPATTLRSTGTLRQGAQPAVTVSSTGTGYTLVGNPYASPIDFESIAGTTNLTQSFYIWDANLSGNFGVGGFRTVERTGANTYQQTPQVAGGTGSDNTMRYIHSGQAFFLKASGADASVVFTEASKTALLPTVNPFRTTNTQPQLLTNLMLIDANNNATLADGIRVRFDNSYSPAVTGEDVTKMSNFSENIASRRDNNLLIVEKRPEVTLDDTVYLNMANMGLKTYRLQVSGVNMPSGLLAYLHDNFTGTQTTVDLNNTTDVDFSVTTNAASSAADRFKIVFRTASALPVTLSSVKAYQQSNDIAVEWKVQDESAIRHYDVEKSVDGRTFSKAATQIATGNNLSTVTYNWLDVNATPGNNFYRIRSVGLNGEIKLSQIVKVTIGKGRADYTVYPNPLTGNTIILQFINQQKGTSHVRLINSLGQIMLSRQIAHEQGSSTQTINISNSIQKGNYILEVTAPDKSKRSLKIIY